MSSFWVLFALLFKTLTKIVGKHEKEMQLFPQLEQLKASHTSKTVNIILRYSKQLFRHVLGSLNNLTSLSLTLTHICIVMRK